MKFELDKHYKLGEYRGFILGPVEDIILAIDDDCMNLQSIAGCP